MGDNMRKLGLILLALALARPALADPVTIRIAWIVAGVDAPLAILGKPGIARHEGQSYKLDWTHFTSTPAELTALASNEIDLAPIGFPAVGLAVENAKMDDLRIIADSLEDGVGNSFSNSFFVLNDGPVKRIEDLKGKVVTVNAVGATIDIAVRVMLKKHGLEANRDYTILESQFPTMKAELLDHKVDLVGLVLPFATDPALNQAAHVLFTQKDMMGPTELLVLTGRKGFIDKNRAALVDFLEDDIRELHWYLDPAHHDEAVQIVAERNKLPPQIFASWLYTPKDSYRDPNAKPDLATLQTAIGVAHEAGVVPAPLDPRPYADLSLVEDAAKRVK
jgi:NitT/TauT family transport system substrate-binding protein